MVRTARFTRSRLRRALRTEVFERYRETALTRWLDATFGHDWTGIVVLGVPAVLAITIWLHLRRAARNTDD